MTKYKTKNKHIWEANIMCTPTSERKNKKKTNQQQMIITCGGKHAIFNYIQQLPAAAAAHPPLGAGKGCTSTGPPPLRHKFGHCCRMGYTCHHSDCVRGCWRLACRVQSPTLKGAFTMVIRSWWNLSSKLQTRSRMVWLMQAVHSCRASLDSPNNSTHFVTPVQYHDTQWLWTNIALLNV